MGMNGCYHSTDRRRHGDDVIDAMRELAQHRWAPDVQLSLDDYSSNLQQLCSVGSDGDKVI